MDLHALRLKTREIRQGCAFWGFVKKCLPHPHQPPNSENFAFQKPFFAQNTNLGGSTTKIRV